MQKRVRTFPLSREFILKMDKVFKELGNVHVIQSQSIDACKLVFLNFAFYFLFAFVFFLLK